MASFMTPFSSLVHKASQQTPTIMTAAGATWLLR